MKAAKTLLAVAMAGIGLTAQAQISRDSYKQRTEMLGLNKKLQNLKVSKASRQQAKQMRKEGWKVAPGGLPLEQQIERSALFQNSFEEDMVTPRYVWGDASATAETYDAGKMQALELARQNLISSIEADITQIIETNRDNKQIGANDAASVISTLSASQTYIAKKLGQTIPTIEIYRELPRGIVQVRVQTFYSMDKARDVAKQIIREEMERKNVGLQGKIDDILNW